MIKNKKGDFGETVKDNAIHIILLVLFFSAVFYYLFSMRNSAAVWGDIYAKEIVKIIELGDVGDEVTLDVHKITGIALRNEVNIDDIFSFKNNEVCVKTSRSRMHCYSYFNDYKIIDDKVVLGVPTNILYFKIEKGGAT